MQFFSQKRLKPLYKESDTKFDLVSCQFAFHYCFGNLSRVNCMLRNISECLKSGGYFVGTIPDRNKIM